MKNVVLAPVIVIGCAVIGVIVGALYFGAALGVPAWITGAAGAADDLGRFLPILGVGALSLGSNKLIDARTVRRASSSR